MTIRNQSFSPEHGLEALLYIVENLKSPTIHEVLKIRYFSDKLHLSRYGALGSGDDYVAMKFGPVASNSYNLVKAARGDSSSYINPYFYQVVDGAMSVSADGKTLVATRSPRMEYLSPAEIECINEAVAKFGGLEFNHRTEISHDAAWKKAIDSAGDGSGSSPMSIQDIAGTLDNANDVIGFITA